MDKSLETHKPFAREFHLRLIRSLLRAIGEDSSREGLLKTPERVVDSWKELFAGYGQDLENFKCLSRSVNMMRSSCYGTLSFILFANTICFLLVALGMLRICQINR